MPPIPVYTGFWHDYSRGPGLDWTLTLSVRWSGYLTAALSTFVGLVGACFWKLLSFAIHQFRATSGDVDVAHLQQQVTYRNPSSPLGTVAQLVEIAWAWRGRSTGKNDLSPASRIKTRSFYLCLPPLLTFIAFTAAGVFVGEVTNPTYKGNNVRVKPTQCGVILYNTESNAGQRAHSLKTVNDTLSARAYASNCYGSSSSLSECSLYPKAELSYSSISVECPFGTDPSGQSLCIPSQALSLDTGLLDSNDDLGINTSNENRLSFRKRVTCSPIQIQNYVEISNDVESGYAIYEYFLGSIGNISNSTFIYDSHTQADNVGYQTFSEFTHADTSLIFLETNSIKYLVPVQDPWFQATNPVNVTTFTFYQANNLVSAMACIDQYQICNPTSSPERCTILGSESDIEIGAQQIGLNDYQEATAFRLLPILFESSIIFTMQGLSTGALLAPATLVSLIGQGLPDNQWQLEVQGWFETALAKIQAYTVSWVANTADLGPYGYVSSPNASGDLVSRAAASFCSNQRIRNTGGYQSFSGLGLLSILCIGSTIVILSLTVELCVDCAAKRRKRSHLGEGVSDCKEVARVANRTLQLQRMALTTAAPRARWIGHTDYVPVTEGDFRFSLVESEAVGFHYESQEKKVTGPSNSNEEVAEKKERNLIGQLEMAMDGEGSQEPVLAEPERVPDDEGAEIQEEEGVDTHEEEEVDTHEEEVIDTHEEVLDTQ